MLTIIWAFGELKSRITDHHTKYNNKEKVKYREDYQNVTQTHCRDVVPIDFPHARLPQTFNLWKTNKPHNIWEGQ